MEQAVDETRLNAVNTVSMAKESHTETGMNAVRTHMMKESAHEDPEAKPVDFETGADTVNTDTVGVHSNVKSHFNAVHDDDRLPRDFSGFQGRGPCKINEKIYQCQFRFN